MLNILGLVWSSPMSLLGFILAMIGKTKYCGRSKYTTALIYSSVDGGLVYWYLTKGADLLIRNGRGARGFAVGAFIFVRDGLHEVPGLIAHESRHVTQSFWFGPAWPIAYGIACAISALRGGNFYYDCWFEADARRAGDAATMEAK